jgi:hypothetical protein
MVNPKNASSPKVNLLSKAIESSISRRNLNYNDYHETPLSPKVKDAPELVSLIMKLIPPTTTPMPKPRAPDPYNSTYFLTKLVGQDISLFQAKLNKTRQQRLRPKRQVEDWEEPDAPIYVSNPSGVEAVTFDQLSNEQQTDLIERQKRLAPAVAIGIAGGALGTFMGLYNQVELRFLQQSINELQRNTNLLVRLTNEHDLKIKDIAKSLVSLSQVVELYLQYNPTVLYARLEEQIDQLEDRLDQALRVVQQLQNRRLSVDFLTGEQLGTLHNELEQIAHGKQLQLLPTKVPDYFQIETSYVRSGKDVLIVLHVPSVHLHHTLTLYKYLPFPFPLPQPTLMKANTIWDSLYNQTSPDTSNQGTPIHEGLFVKTESDFLAVGKDGHYKLMSTDEVSLCEKHSRFFMCEEHQVLKTQMADSCLGALYLRMESAAKIHCKFEKKILAETVYQLSPTDHLVYAPFKYTSEIRCTNGSTFPLFISTGNNKIHIPEGCQAELKNHLITSDSDIRVTPQPLQSLWKWNPMSLSSSLLVDPDKSDQYLFALQSNLNRLNHHVNQADNHITEVQDNLQTLKEISVSASNFAAMLMQNLLNPEVYPQSWWIIIGIFSTIMTIAFLWCCCNHTKCGRSISDRCLGAGRNLLPAPFIINNLPPGNNLHPGIHYNAVAQQVSLPNIQLCRHNNPIGQCCGLKMI